MAAKTNLVKWAETVEIELEEFPAEKKNIVLDYEHGSDRQLIKYLMYKHTNLFVLINYTSFKRDADKARMILRLRTDELVTKKFRELYANAT